MAGRSMLASLPVTVTLEGYDLLLHRLRPEQLSEAYMLVCAEAAAGRDVGEDEFPSEASLLTHTSHSHSFGFSDPHTGALRALVTVAPSAYSRMSNPLLADGIIICELGVKGRIIQALIQVSLNLTANLGYEGVLADVFSSSELVGRLRAEGFTVIGCVPNSGHLKGKGWTDSLIMFKDLKASTSQVHMHMSSTPRIQLRPTKNDDDNKRTPSSGDVTSSTSSDFTLHSPTDVTTQTSSDVTTHTVPHSGVNDQPHLAAEPSVILPLSALMHLNQKPNLHYLPCCYTFRTGEQVRLRYLEETDISQVYNMYREAARRGQGFSTDEFNSLENFRFCVIDHGHAIVAEEVSTCRILVATSILPSILCRSVDPQLADPYIIVDYHFQQKGLGSEVSQLMIRLIHDLGYTGVLADILVKNVPMLKIMRNLGFAIVGYIPKAAKGKDHKSADILLCFKDLEDRLDAISKL